MTRQFRTPAAFKTSLETHLRKRAEQSALPFQTMQLKFVMERLLARLFQEGQPPWLLKGGFAMDLRFRPKARTTKDIDLSVSLETAKGTGADTVAMRDRLQGAADIDLGDHLVFRIGKAKHELTNAPGGGARYPCEATLAGKVYAKFQIDIGIGDAVIGTPERLVGDDVLSFAGIAPATVLAIPTAQHSRKSCTHTHFPGKDARIRGPRTWWTSSSLLNAGRQTRLRFAKALQQRSLLAGRTRSQPISPRRRKRGQPSFPAWRPMQEYRLWISWKRIRLSKGFGPNIAWPVNDTIGQYSYSFERP